MTRATAGFGCAVAWLVVLTGMVLLATVALLRSTDGCLTDPLRPACSPRAALIVVWAPIGGVLAATVLLIAGYFRARRHGESIAPWAVAGYSLVVLGLVLAYATAHTGLPARAAGVLGEGCTAPVDGHEHQPITCQPFCVKGIVARHVSQL